MLRLLLILTFAIQIGVSVLPEDVDVFRYSDSDDYEISYEKIKNVPSGASKKYETARSFLQNYNSLKPVAVLVDETKDAYDDAKKFMNRAVELSPNIKSIPFTLQTFNATGVSQLIEINDNNTFENCLNYTQKVGISYLDSTDSNRTALFFAVLNAASKLHHGTGILVFISRKIGDEDLAYNTGILRNKSIRVYVIWGGMYPTKSNEEYLLEELCEYSGGLFLVNTDKDLSDFYYRQFISDRNLKQLNTSIILIKNNLLGPTDLTFPVDGNVTGIHITIKPAITIGYISTPNEHTVNLLKKEEVSGYSAGSFEVTEMELHVVHLNITTASTPGVGIWRLKLNNALAPYNVTIFAYTKLDARVYYIGMDEGHQNSVGSDGDVMKLGISTTIMAISNISFVDKDGQTITDNAKYTLVKDSLKENYISDKDKEIVVQFYNITGKPQYAVIKGKDSDGNDFSRLTYISPYTANDIFPQPTLTIEVGAGSELITTGGKFPVIIFEVTNNKDTAVDVRFTCRDRKSILRFLQPYRRLIGPRETTTVRLTLITRFGSYEDEVNFTAWIGSESFQKKVIVDVGNQALNDDENPEINYSFSGDCSKIVFSKCSEGTWTVKIVAKDSQSGLLQVTTYPKGIYFPDGFTTGTREEVTGVYSDSCCNPDLQVTAVDRLNNRKVINVNAYVSYWGPGQIAALVLGIAIVILLIGLVAFVIVRCLKSKKTFELPTYRGTTSSI